MTIIQKIHLTFQDGNKRGIIIEEYKNKYLAMFCDEGFYGMYIYVADGFSNPIFFETALEIVQKYIDIWSEKSALAKVESTNEFIEIEELKELYPQSAVLHV